MKETLTLRRDDFSKLSDGSSIFDRVMTVVGIRLEAKDVDKIHEIEIYFDREPRSNIYDEDGKRLVRIWNPNDDTQRIESIDDSKEVLDG